MLGTPGEPSFRAETMKQTTASLAKRVVSLLPSGTEILCLIPGGAELLVGRSHEDNYPASITHLPMLTDQLISKSWTDAAAVDREVSAAMAEGRSLYSLVAKLLAVIPCHSTTSPRS